MHSISLNCAKLQNKITKQEYESLFGADKDPMIKIIQKIENIIDERKQLLEI